MNRLKAVLDASIEKNDFSGVVGIYRDGEALYEAAAGYADRVSRVANTIRTRFGTASGTKIFTAMAIGKLIETGKLSFSTRLKDCVSVDLPPYPDDLTIRHLLTHTSGIADYYDEETVEDFENFTVGVPWSELRGPKDYLQVFPREGMKFVPGERFSYSNGGYILLGVVVEEVTGRRYRDFVTEQIFKPIGMTHSGYFAMDKLPEGTALGYIGEDADLRTNIKALPVIGASDGGAFTTLHDLTTMWGAWRDGRILSKEMVDIFAKPYVEATGEGPQTFYGHGMWICKKSGLEEYITGCDAGVSFKSGVHRAVGIQFTVLSNTTDGAWPILKDMANTGLLGGNSGDN